MDWLIESIEASGFDPYESTTYSSRFELSFLDPVPNCFL
jgi:hypothetical protein